MVVDLRDTDKEWTGAATGKWLEAAGIIVSKSTVPNDPRSPMQTSGLRLGSPALTTRGFKPPQMRQVAKWIDRVLKSGGDAAVAGEVRGQIVDLCKQFPLAH